jgi:maleylacetoacetate isomerase
MSADPPDHSAELTLYGYWRSSASYRVRLALAIKGLDYRAVPIHLITDGGQQHQADYRALNPQGLVPTMLAGEHVLTQSLAIIEYLEERFPSPALLPAEPLARAQVRAIAQAIACDIAPLANLRVLNHLKAEAGWDQRQIEAWIRHWLSDGLAAVEKLLAKSPAPYCWGNQPGLADCCLLPQVYNAERFALNLDGLERITAICSQLRAHPALAGAHPEAQEDAQKDAPPSV